MTVYDIVLPPLLQVGHLENLGMDWTCEIPKHLTLPSGNQTWQWKIHSISFGDFHVETPISSGFPSWGIDHSGLGRLGISTLWVKSMLTYVNHPYSHLDRTSSWSCLACSIPSPFGIRVNISCSYSIFAGNQLPPVLYSAKIFRIMEATTTPRYQRLIPKWFLGPIPDSANNRVINFRLILHHFCGEVFRNIGKWCHCINGWPVNGATDIAALKRGRRLQFSLQDQ